MPIAQVQTNKLVNTTANATPTLVACTAGNLITIQARFAAGLPTITDPAGFSRDVSIDNGGASPCALILAKVAVGGETAFAFTNGAGGTWEIEVAEWSGTATSSPLDTTNTNTGAAVTSLSPGSITPGATGELLLAIATQSNTNGGGETAGSGYTLMDAATFTFMEAAFKIKTDALAENPALGWTTSRNAWGVHAAYKVFGAVASVALPDRSYPRGVARGVTRGVA